MSSFPVYIAVYKSAEGNYLHWSLYVQGIQDDIYEVVGEHPEFKYNHIHADPENTERHRKNILVGYVTERDLTTIKHLLPGVIIDNENPGWTCQDWVLEALEELCSEFILEEDDDDYKDGVQEATEKYYGPQ